MNRIVSNSVLASEVAEFLKRDLVGENVAIYGPATKDSIRDQSMLYLQAGDELPLAEINSHKDVLILSEKALPSKINASYILIKNVEFEFIKAINYFFTEGIKPNIHPTVIIEKGARVGEGVSVMAGSYIGADVEIGENTVIAQNVVISGKVKVGRDCFIKPNATIGSEIFHFVYGDGQWVNYPQVGRIVIEDNVWIGANSTIEKGTLSDTVIKKGARIDDLVQVGSSSVVGEEAIVAAGVVLCRDVRVGAHSWVAPNVTIREQLVIGDRATVGMGAVVIQDVAAKTTVAGNPAKKIVRREKGNGRSKRSNI